MQMTRKRRPDRRCKSATVGDLTTSESVHDLMAGKSVIARQWHWSSPARTLFRCPVTGRGHKKAFASTQRFTVQEDRQHWPLHGQQSLAVQCRPQVTFTALTCARRSKWWTLPLGQLANLLPTYRVRKPYDCTQMRPNCFMLCLTISLEPTSGQFAEKHYFVLTSGTNRVDQFRIVS